MRNKLAGSLALLLSTVAVAADMNWSPEGLSKELHPIATLESSFGKNTKHEAHSKGPFYSSYGAVGLKGSTAYETYLRSPYLKKRYPGLSDRDLFLGTFTNDFRFYNACSNVHWYWLKGQTKNIEQSVYAWRWGVNAALKAADITIEQDKYVSSYLTLAIK